jgi:tetratricopeptide (TPR) repeat protein
MGLNKFFCVILLMAVIPATLCAKGKSGKSGKLGNSSIPTMGDSADWIVKEAPYRATFQMVSSPNEANGGFLLELPDIGSGSPDHSEVTLIDPDGNPIPVVPIWAGNGCNSLFLAKEMKPGVNYQLYFGDQTNRLMTNWTPHTSLLLETRTMGAYPQFDNLQDMNSTWYRCKDVDGVGFVDKISRSGNPYGPDWNFASKYTGYLLTPKGGTLRIYTRSSDASFVLVDGKELLSWPGMHDVGTTSGHGKITDKNLRLANIPCSKGVTKIEYYQAKYSGGDSYVLLGWVFHDSYDPIPDTAWVHPGKTKMVSIEQQNGFPVPIATINFISYMSYEDQFLYNVTVDAPKEMPAGWDAEWHFESGAVLHGAHVETVLVGDATQKVTLILKNGDHSFQSVTSIHFPQGSRAVKKASVNNTGEVGRYLELISVLDPNTLNAKGLEQLLPILLQESAKCAGSFATAWLRFNPPSTDHLWLSAFLASVRYLAQSDPAGAIKMVRSAPHNQYNKELLLLELDLLVYYLKDPSAQLVESKISTTYGNIDSARIAAIRLGDLARLSGQNDQAISRYNAIQKTIPDDTGGRKLPAMDRAYALSVENFLSQGDLHAAAGKLREWELAHPMAKIDADFLLDEARLLAQQGEWGQELAEIDSYKALHPDSPEEIEADFLRAQALAGLGRKSEAQAIWKRISTDYPNNDVADQCLKMLKQP